MWTPKGAYTVSAWNDQWRRPMMAGLIGHWAGCVARLHHFDVICSHWLTHVQFPGRMDEGYPAGKFWWARRSYLASLEPPSLKNRHEAKAWLGHRIPRVGTLASDWPTPETLYTG
jgi:hypothetical protein